MWPDAYEEVKSIKERIIHSQQAKKKKMTEENRPRWVQDFHEQAAATHPRTPNSYHAGDFPTDVAPPPFPEDMITMLSRRVVRQEDQIKSLHYLVGVMQTKLTEMEENYKDLMEALDD